MNPALPGRISPDTTAKVEKAARELGYQPDPTARSLRTRRSGFVGVVVPDLTNPVLPPMVRAIEETMWKAGLACLLADTDNRPERETALIDELRARRCEGLIVATATRRSLAVRGLVGGDVPTVLVTRDIDEGSLHLVTGDDASGVAAAVDHLADLGHRHIASLTGPADLSTTSRRQAAFRSAMAQRLGVDDPIVVHGDGFTVPAGRQATVEVLDSHPDVTAILAGNDMMALGVYLALDDRGLACPADISVVGHNDMPFMDQVDPPLTTVRVPQVEVGAEAARTLLALRAGEMPPLRRVLPTSLVVRGSSAEPFAG